ncbi:helix-turn-helix domain-containing protein [Zhenpiania hominis]|uniref:Helix-turn-helix transcriptional regulator n=1 Tax=Zhenpiania hominis TaxID=2763644 RepID=A0A923SQK7_9FIRM|nr:helix-turn-helix transcriptional regulator [Zhenpiania hominis]MBC6679585.1 helix-turn-helix transcriptional regulator [Zhenpiania hominis]
MVYLNLKEVLKKSGKSKYWLVRKLDTNYTALNKMLENETSSISFATIDKLLKLFDCPIEELFVVEQDKQPEETESNSSL